MQINKTEYGAKAVIKGGAAAPELSGTVEFFKKPEGVLVVVNVKGLPEGSGAGFFGFHIHEGTSCGGEDFGETGGHFNPTNSAHPRHAGDLPPLLSNNGKAYMEVLSNRFSVKDVIGRTVVIHSGTDDFISQPAGNAGSKIACGVIRAI